MSSRAKFARAFHLGSWAILLCAYLVVSGPKIWPVLSSPAIRSSDALSSTDAYLHALTGRAHASAQILATLAPLPVDKAVVLVLPDAGVRSAFIAQNVSYLSWPREVRWVCAEGGQAKNQILAMPPTSLAAIIFWDVAPIAWLPSGVRLGAGQVIIPMRPSA